uniref:G-protein coupled receptors family 1 profile domain-containing protein n=1 Tax=Plectus sambesii TaxID=2011161 RepID=A0A914UYT0_9BILA
MDPDVGNLSSVAVNSSLDDQLADSRPWNLLELISIGSVLVTIILSCVIGNLFVIMAILFERDLRRPQYYLIFSLAVADLLVGVIVSPLATLSELQRRWTLGVTVCDIWISVDVLVCTSSILHLVAIALDRYWSITDIGYMQNRTPKRIFIMISIVWVVSLLISVAPIFGWKDSRFEHRVNVEHICLISQELSYQVFSTATAFYIPLFAIMAVYYKIFRAAKRRFKRERDRKTFTKHSLPSTTHISAHTANTMIAPATGAKLSLPVKQKAATRQMQIEEDGPSAVSSVDGSDDMDDERTPMHTNGRQLTQLETALDGSDVGATRTAPASVTPKTARFRLKKRSKESAETRREQKAWRTLAIITGTFVACWLPFFLISLYRPICRCRINPAVESVAAWLGYLNSAINPIIYTIFSPDFRQAFQRILKRICFLHES